MYIHYQNKYYFSLIELLVVMAILGALMSLIMPAFHDVGKDAKEQVAYSEMREIQQAFQLFARDVIFRSEIRDHEQASNKKLYDIAMYGLWPLLCDKHPVLTNGETNYIEYGEYNIDTGIGRRGPYLAQEGIMNIFPVTINNSHTISSACGQENTINNTIASNDKLRIPVIKDPFGGYYRVICPAPRTDSNGNNLNEFNRLKRIVLVCTGPNQKLETFPNNFANNNPHPSIADEIIANGDDIIIRLMPILGF